MSDIFVSHSAIDRAATEVLRDWLVSEGWSNLFVDFDAKHGIAAGEKWERALSESAERCEAVIFLVSKNWLASRWCRRELHLALRHNKRLFPTVIDDTKIDDLPPELTDRWQVISLYNEGDDRVGDVRFSSDGLAKLKRGLHKAGLHPGYFDWPPPEDPARSPYRGLRPLEAIDAGIYFGRDAQMIRALDMLRGLNDSGRSEIFVILGASGAGKSSFLRAGLWPRWKRDDSNYWPLPIVRPERSVFNSDTGLIRCMQMALEGSLQVTRDEIEDYLRQNVDGLLQLLSSSATRMIGRERHQKAPTIVLSIDQGEELFAPERTGELKAFLKFICQLLCQKSLRILVVFTIRSDNYEPLQAAPELAGIPQTTFSLAPMPRSALLEVITGPAARSQGTPREIKIAPELVQELLMDVDSGEAKDALPLLAFTLERMYASHGSTGKLTLDQYNALSRVKGSIESAVADALQLAEKDHRMPRSSEARLELLRKGIIPWLASIDPDTGSPRRRVAKRSEIPPQSLPLLDLLTDQHLLSTDVSAETGEKTIEPSHESLLRQWGLLQQWLKEDMSLLTQLEGLKRAAKDWSGNNRGSAWIIHGGNRLRAIESISERPDLAASLQESDLDYLHRAQALERQQLSNRRRITTSLVALASSLVLLGGGWWKQAELLQWYYRLTVLRPAPLSQAQEIELAKGTRKSAFTECALGCPELIPMPPGKFRMGFDLQRREVPVHDVELVHAVGVGTTEVTNRDWQACVDYGPCKTVSGGSWQGASNDEQPVINVTWNDAKAFVAWLTTLTGKQYRLLSEAEWEYAARAKSSTHFHFGNDDGRLRDYGWYAGNSEHRAHNVKTLKPNQFGLYDMHGNVAEWVEDCWHENYEGAPKDGAPWLDAQCDRRVFRGGSWLYGATMQRSAARDYENADKRANHIGFRVARTLGNQ